MSPVMPARLRSGRRLLLTEFMYNNFACPVLLVQEIGLCVYWGMTFLVLFNQLMVAH